MNLEWAAFVTQQAQKLTALLEEKRAKEMAADKERLAQFLRAFQITSFVDEDQIQYSAGLGVYFVVDGFYFFLVGRPHSPTKSFYIGHEVHLTSRMHSSQNPALLDAANIQYISSNIVPDEIACKNAFEYIQANNPPD